MPMVLFGVYSVAAIWARDRRAIHFAKENHIVLKTPAHPLRIGAVIGVLRLGCDNPTHMEIITFGE